MYLRVFLTNFERCMVYGMFSCYYGGNNEGLVFKTNLYVYKSCTLI